MIEVMIIITGMETYPDNSGIKQTYTVNYRNKRQLCL